VGTEGMRYYILIGNDGRQFDIQKWKIMVGGRRNRDGIIGRRYDTQRWDLMEGDTIYRDWNRWQAKRYTEKGINGRRYDIC